MGNDAMASVLKSCTYRLAPEAQEMQLRQGDPHSKLRNRRASAALMREAQGHEDNEDEQTGYS